MILNLTARNTLISNNTLWKMHTGRCSAGRLLCIKIDGDSQTNGSIEAISSSEWSHSEEIKAIALMCLLSHAPEQRNAQAT